MKPSKTKRVAYFESPVPVRCGTCVYLVDGHLCKNKEVKLDDQIPTDRSSGLKIVDPEDGHCKLWEKK